MEEGERKIQLQVRALSGETTTVSMSSSKTVHDLKLLLKLNFPPASNSPNFHLFFEGVKLSLRSQVSTLSIAPGKFVVLIPFTKKDRSQIAEPGCSQTSSNVTEQNLISNKFADSTYSDMMQELSSLHQEESNNINPNKPEYGASYTMPFGNINSDISETKRKRGVDCDNQEGSPYDFLWSVLQSKTKNALEGQNCEKFVEVLESVNCLSDPYSGKCMLLREANMRGTGGGLYKTNSNNSSCFCPVWLKKIMEAFAFLSIFSAYLQLRREEVTLTHLKDALDQLGKFGVPIGIEDIEHLSVLCPKVVQFAHDDMESKNCDASIVIIDVSREERDKVEDNIRTGQKATSLSKIFNAMKKWESSFKTNLWEAVKSLVCKIRKPALSLSLEDLLIFVKERGTVFSGNGAKQPKTSWSSASNSHAFQRRCSDTSQLPVMEMVEHLRKGIGSQGQIVHIEDIHAREAVHVEIPDALSDNTKTALKSIGISKLYSHQAESIMASLSGKNVVVATMTSSGKSLCYNLLVLEALSYDLSSCALYMFPTKALAQDQLRSLLSMTKAFDTIINIGVYDGDTSQKDRIWLRDNARLLITNPDMLHMSILPLHRHFSRILSNLRFVVIDEAHAYKGAFGCHTALILRRLRRLCSHVYGSDPSFVFSTATSANPREHCMELANLSALELINNDGSPSARKLFVLWNPSSSVLNKSPKDDMRSAANKSSSPISEVSYLFAEMVQHGLRCIAFCRSRKLCELILSYTREILEKTAPHLVDTICVYRAGYIAEDRRRIERDFFGGKLCGIAATNALELGIDVGHIDVTLHLGFPGSIASLWQQAGRSGRRERPSLAVYVAFEDPLDQYFMKYPEKLFRSPIECCHIDSQNQKVLEQHLVCAALEHPLSLICDEKYFGSGLCSAVMTLKNIGYLSSDPSHDSSAQIFEYIGHEKKPSHTISIRAIETERYEVIDMERNEVLEQIEDSKAFFQVYEGAVYMHQGNTYLVKELNISNKTALCQKADLKYFTKTRDYTDIHVIGGNIAYPTKVSKDQSSRTTAQAHVCNVTTTWFGFHRLWRGTGIIFDTVELYLPKYTYESQAVWIQVPQSVKAMVEQKFSFRSGLHAACHALLHVVPLYIRCNYSDLAPECPNPHETRYFPERILLYDKHPGGTGVSKQIQPYFTELLVAALELLTSCHCSGETGCPNCVQNLNCSEYNELIQKDAAIMIIEGVLEAEKSYFEGILSSLDRS
ncbi:ATP-dependent helicase [Melia azedarach]|uniref:ATP-dependent helicase n=1 Tax=Melia azedarach TaxID=155640 RepID=A0ACC1XSI3_MELAZ|nr:ATP-dependent helicase [Melia azedarach]